VRRPLGGNILHRADRRFQLYGAASDAGIRRAQRSSFRWPWGQLWGQFNPATSGILGCAIRRMAAPSEGKLASCRTIGYGRDADPALGAATCDASPARGPHVAAVDRGSPWADDVASWYILSLKHLVRARPAPARHGSVLSRQHHPHLDRAVFTKAPVERVVVVVSGASPRCDPGGHSGVRGDKW
jgi:hypothetical protein